MSKEIERAGIPTALVSAIVPLAANVGANRIIEGKSITHPLGDPQLPKGEEKVFRRKVVERALSTLTTEVKGQLIVPLREK
jgi:betaine reductase